MTLNCALVDDTEEGVIDDPDVRRNKKRYTFKRMANGRKQHITPRVMRAARKEPLPAPVVKSTLVRRERALELWNEYASQTNAATANEFATCLAQIFAPSTCHGLLVTAAAKVRRLKECPTLNDAKLILQQEIARQRVRRVVTGLEHFVNKWACQSEFMRMAIALQFTTASRHADIAQCNLTHCWNTEEGLIYRLEFPVWKSDRTGSLTACKVAFWPGTVNELKRTVSQWPTYKQVYDALHPILTPHDIRRLALTMLSRVGKKTANALLLTGHADAIRGTKHLRRYTQPSPIATESRTQIRLSKILWTAFEQSL